jgi:hypothetical protein
VSFCDQFRLRARRSLPGTALKGEVIDFKEYLQQGPDFDELELRRSTEGPRTIDWAAE